MKVRWLLVGVVLLAAFSARGGPVALQAAPRAPRLLTVSAGGPYSSVAGRLISFNAAVSGAAAGSLPTCTWSFGDGSSGFGCSTGHSYSTPGSYGVMVTASAGGQSASDSTTATVTGGLSCTPGGPYTGQVDQPISMSASVSGADTPFTYTWSFGDGSTGLGQTTSHVYTAAGSYTVSLSAAGSSGQSVQCGSTTAMVTGSLSVSDDGPYSGQVNQPVTMTATAEGASGGVAFSWLFGDGSSGQGASVSHAYSAAGKYDVTVSAASNGQSASATTSAVIGSSGSATYPPGWSLVGAPAGTSYSQCEGPLYTLQPGDSAYEIVDAGTGVTAGDGYWCYFAARTTVMLNGSSESSASVLAPAGQYVMVGNPSASQTLTVRGADSAFIYDAAAGAYTATTTLVPGQGAWVLTIAGGAVTLAP